MLQRILIVTAAILLATCASTGGDARKLQETLYAYQSTIRWGDLGAAMGFVDPERRDELQPSDLEQRRMAQLQVVGYYVQSRSEPEPGRYQQVVEIRLVNRNTQVERSVIDRQSWRWSPQDKTWWLESGLPSFARE